ncbi:DUF298-domain-containing protein, partial [Hesseltinella vesiculosa]
ELMLLSLNSKKEAQHYLKQANWDVQQALNLFYEKPLPKGNPNKDCITVDGTMAFCQDLSIDPTELEFLLVSHHLGSEQMGEFQRLGFVQGCLSLQCESVAQIREALSQARARFDSDPAYFRKMYNYAFVFGRLSGQKSLALDAAIELWRLLLTSKFSQLDQWLSFLETKHKKAISKDTWTLFLDFALQPNFDIDTHDAEGAWPILIDDVRIFFYLESKELTPCYSL